MTKYNFNSESQINLRALRKERASIYDKTLSDYGCNGCGEHSHGGVCVYCFPIDAKRVDEIEKKLENMVDNTMFCINLTQHQLTPGQVWDLPGRYFGLPEAEEREIMDLLNFVGLPTKDEIGRRATHLVAIALAKGATHALVGGAPYLMPQLHVELEKVGVVPVYSFTERKSVETNNPDGTVTKTQIFEHAGYIGL